MYICRQLQQFRQKKDGKGSGSGKSTKKSSKSEKHEADADAVSSATKPTALTQAPEGETESRVDANLENISTSGSHSGEISTASDIDVASAAPSAVPITHEGNAVDTLIDKNAELASQEVGFSQHDVNFSATNDGESTAGTDAEEARVGSLDTSHVMDSGGLAKDANMSVPVDVSAQPTSVDNTDQTKGRDEEPLPSPESINTSLVQEREDQVTNVGCALLLLLFNFLLLWDSLGN